MNRMTTTSVALNAFAAVFVLAVAIITWNGALLLLAALAAITAFTLWRRSSGS